jgi:cell division protein FtsA
VAKSEIVVALDIGTTKICTLVAEIAGEDQIEIIGLGLAPSTGMRKGVVVDIPATMLSIRDSVSNAEKAAGVDIGTVYVGITGEHIGSQTGRASVAVQGEITEEHLNQVRLAARQITLPHDREILHNIPRQYIVDGQEGIRHPVGMSASKLEIETHVVTGATAFIENVLKSVEKAKLEIEELVIEPLATGLAVLSDAERQLGVCLADIGGGTTDVALFVDGVVTHTKIIPVGGNHVTNDMALLFRLAPDDAERVKVQHGAARVEDVEADEWVEMQLIGEEEPREIPRHLLPKVIGPRMEELFTLLREHLEFAAADGVHVTTCVLSGGGAQLVGAAEQCQKILEIPVRVGRPRDVIDPRSLVDHPMFATATGLLQFASHRIPARRAHKESKSLAHNALRRLIAIFKPRT